MNNNRCVLVEFINESDSLGVGFQHWLNKDNNNPKVLKRLIETNAITEISWPCCEIKSAARMTKIVKTLKDSDWMKHPVKVLAIGGKKYFCSNLNLYVMFVKQKCQFFMTSL